MSEEKKNLDTNRYYSLSFQDLKVILTYLVKRPYGEVFQLVEIIQNRLNEQKDENKQNE